MKIQIEKDQLLRLLTPCQALAEKRNIIPILSKLLIQVEKNELRIFATDQENSLQAHLPIKGDDGVVCVDARNLFDIVKELPKEKILLQGVQGKKSLKIETSSSVFHVVSVPFEDYPVFPSMKNPQFFSTSAKDLFSLVDQTVYCVSLDETRYHLNGVFLEKKEDILRFVATDGHRLSYAQKKIKKPFQIPKGIIIPRKGLQELNRLLSAEEHSEVHLAIEPPRVLVRYGSFLLSVRLIEGKYPNYEQLIPKTSKIKITIQKEELIQGLKRVSILSNAQSKSVLFEWGEKELVLKSKHSDSGDAKEEIPLKKTEGGVIHIRFNARYVLEALQRISADEVIFGFNQSSSPGVLTTKESDHVCIIMPMKL